MVKNPLQAPFEASETATGHLTVLLNEAVDAWLSQANGLYVDGTFGRGGHSRLLLSRLGPEARLIGIDKDPQAIAEGQRLAQQDARFQIYQGSFTELSQALNQFAPGQRVDGLLMDLGVSSPQLDDPERGFSFLRDGPLDMRMNPAVGQSAAQWLAQASEEAMSDVFFHLGEERYARRIARALVAAREQAPILRTGQLAELVKAAHPRWEKNKHPATRVFQAIRIHINRELDDLDVLLSQALDHLAPQGRLVVISFHSLEDRRVKRFIRDETTAPVLPRHLPLPDQPFNARLRRLGKAIRPSAAEVAANPRARSAVMRVAEKIGD